MPRRARDRGQSLAEFALVAPIMLALLAGIVQFGMLFSYQNSLIQLARDTGRWASTQTVSPCDDAAVQTKSRAIAATTIFAYNDSDLTVTIARSGDACPPADANAVSWVGVTVDYNVPVLLPGVGTCTGGRCFFVLSQASQFRMEPPP